MYIFLADIPNLAPISLQSLRLSHQSQVTQGCCDGCFDNNSSSHSDACIMSSFDDQFFGSSGFCIQGDLGC